MDPLTWPEISRTSSRSVKLTTNGNIVYVFVCANPESPPDLHLLDLEEKSTSVDHVRDLLAESYGADRYQVEGLPIFGKAGGIITAANSHGYSCGNVFVAIESQSSSNDHTTSLLASNYLSKPAEESCLHSSSQLSQGSSSSRESPRLPTAEVASGQLQSSDGVKSCYELKDIPSEVPVPPPMPCDDEIRPSTSMLKLRRHKKPPHHMSSDCLQVQGSQQESHSTLSKRWSFPYFEGVQNTLMGQSKLNGDTTTSSFSTVRCKSSDEYSHEEQFGVAEVEKGVRKNTTFHCQDTANLCSSQEEKRKANKGKQSPCMNTSSIKHEQRLIESQYENSECHKEVCAIQEQNHESNQSCDQQQSRSQQIDHEAQGHAQRVVQPQPASGSEQMHSQGTPPGNCNPIVYETKKVQHQLSAHDRIVVPEMNPVPKELSGDEHQEAVFVYQNPCTRTYVTPDNDEGDDELAEEKITPLNVNDVKEKQLPSYDHKKYKCTDREMMYTSKEFYGETQLSCGSNCAHVFPSPRAMQQLLGEKRFPFATSVENLQDGLFGCPHEFQMLPKESFLGSGGNGVTAEHMLSGQKYALKWMEYIPEVFNQWSKFDHPNIISLLAVVNVIPGCYAVMHRMTGDLGAVMKDVGDLFSMACSESKEDWQKIVKPNIQHIIVSILGGVAYLHSKGYLHRDLKETNILYLKRCNCVDILHCKCPQDNKCDIMLADFDSLEAYLSSCYSPKFSGVVVTPAGTRYYRSPETHCGITAPCCDMWSVGVILTSLCHSSEERKKIREDCRRVIPNPDNLKDKRKFPVIETAYGREMLSSLREKCTKKPDQLGLLMRIAGLCLSLNNEERVSAQRLLDDFFN